MTRVAVDLPEETARWAQSLVDRGEVPSVGEYLAELLRRDHEQAEDAAWLQAEIDKGAASGVSPKSLDEIFDEVETKHFT